MQYIAIRTDKPEAELYISSESAIIAQYTWTAHRQLSHDILTVIEQFLSDNGVTLQTLDGIVFYDSGASFTGLRIGASVANALAASLQIPVVAQHSPEWCLEGARILASGSVLPKTYVEPVYASEAIVTKPKK